MLRSIRYGEADRILHLYTPDLGRIGAIAKGVRARGAGSAGGWSRASRSPRPAPGAQRSDDRHRRRHHRLPRAAARARARARRGVRACDAVNRLFGDGRAPSAASTTCSATSSGCSTASPSRGEPRPNQLAFRLKLLVAAGFAPQLGLVRVVRRGARTSVGFSRRRGRRRLRRLRGGPFPFGEEAHAFMTGRSAAAGRGARRRGAGAAPGRARDHRDARAPRGRAPARRGRRRALRGGTCRTRSGAATMGFGHRRTQAVSQSDRGARRVGGGGLSPLATRSYPARRAVPRRTAGCARRSSAIATGSCTARRSGGSSTRRRSSSRPRATTTARG